MDRPVGEVGRGSQSKKKGRSIASKGGRLVSEVVDRPKLLRNRRNIPGGFEGEASSGSGVRGEDIGDRCCRRCASINGGGVKYL